MSGQGHRRRAVRLSALGDSSATLLDLLRRGMERKIFEAVLVPMAVPSRDGYAHILIHDRELLARATPLPPIMATSGGDVLTSLTRRGQSDLKVAAVMRPCEMRAVVELVKLGQVDLGNITLISMDCPGALALKDYHKDPRGEEDKFKLAKEGWGERDLRRMCQICQSMCMVSGDLHLGARATAGSAVPLVSSTEKGDIVLQSLDLVEEWGLEEWEAEARKVQERHEAQRAEWRSAFAPLANGPENLLELLSDCINCHNCMRVCPVCYCRVCYFDSDRLRHKAGDYLEQASRKGALRLPPDNLLFHMGRMAHMTLTCVSCGACEDACPASIPVAQLFSLVAERTQRTFEYLPGRNVKDALPLTVYREEELEGDEDG